MQTRLEPMAATRRAADTLRIRGRITHAIRDMAAGRPQAADLTARELAIFGLGRPGPQILVQERRHAWTIECCEILRVLLG